VEWFNPSTGATTVASPIAAGSSSQSFTPPFSGDAVLYLVDAAGHAGSVPLPTSYSVTGLVTGTYRYRVRATDAAGNLGPYSNLASATVEGPDTQPPTAPTNLTATTPAAGQIRLSWVASTDDRAVMGYLVERCQGAGCTTFTQVAAAGTVTTFDDTGLAASTNYAYRIRAADAANNRGPYSNTATATTLPAPAGISLVQHRNVDAGSAASSSLSFSTTNGAGNWIAVAIRSAPNSQALTVTDTRGNTYRRAIQLNETVDGIAVALYYAENIVGGSNTVTVSKPQAGGTLRFAILEYSGVALANSLDVTVAAQGTSATPSSGTVTSTSSGDLVIGVIATSNERTFTAGGVSHIEERVPAPPYTKLIVEDRKQSTAGPLSAWATLNASDHWGAVVAAFRAR
jgi:chitodextrinase